MRVHGVTIEDTFAEAFRVWACRLIVTAIDPHWARVAAREVTGYGTSVIGCDAEAGIESELGPDQTPDGRPGVAMLFIAFNAPSLAQAMPKRVGQCLMTAPTTAVYDGLGGRGRSPTDEGATRIELGNRLRYFGDGWQRSKVVDFAEGPRRFWRVPVMDGEFTVEDTLAAVKQYAADMAFLKKELRSATEKKSALFKCLSRFSLAVLTVLASMVTSTLELAGFLSSIITVPVMLVKLPRTVETAERVLAAGSGVPFAVAPRAGAPRTSRPPIR